LREVIEEHLGVSTKDQDDDDENQLERPIYTIQNARKAVQVLIDFTETQDDLGIAHLRALERLEQAVERLYVSSQK
jgi:hypothetical protein